MALRPISIEQLIPGMYVVEMDVPWYRTPFLSHKRLIHDQQTIQTMRQHGIKKVTIDTTKGCDLPSSTPTETPRSPDSAAPASIAPVASSQQAEQRSEPIREDQIVSIIYAQAQEAVERIFNDLERGIPPSPEATKTVVYNVLTQVLSDRTAMATQVAIQQIKQFVRSILGGSCTRYLHSSAGGGHRKRPRHGHAGTGRHWSITPRCGLCSITEKSGS